jgi:hypothetical protein
MPWKELPEVTRLAAATSTAQRLPSSLAATSSTEATVHGGGGVWRRRPVQRMPEAVRVARAELAAATTQAAAEVDAMMAATVLAADSDSRVREAMMAAESDSRVRQAVAATAAAFRQAVAATAAATAMEAALAESDSSWRAQDFDSDNEAGEAYSDNEAGEAYNEPAGEAYSDSEAEQAALAAECQAEVEAELGGRAAFEVWMATLGGRAGSVDVDSDIVGSVARTREELQVEDQDQAAPKKRLRTKTPSAF